jgi:hypothetical protein
MKEMVHMKKPHTINIIKREIHQQTAAIPEDMLQDVLKQVSRFIRIYQ